MLQIFMKCSLIGMLHISKLNSKHPEMVFYVCEGNRVANFLVRYLNQSRLSDKHTFKYTNLQPKRQKDKRAKGQKDKRTKGRKDKKTKRQKDKKELTMKKTNY